MLKTIIVLLVTLVILPLVAIYVDTPLEPTQWQMLQTGGWMAFAVAMACFVVGELTRNCSQTDKLWSIVPLAYAWYFAYASEWNDRLVLMAVLVTVWGIRLTYNFSRRGGYSWKFWSGEEDYRWAVLRQNALFKDKPLRWFFFNLFFISLYQHGLIFLFTLPALMAWQGHQLPLYWADYLLAAAFLGLVVLETIADQEQWNYQTEKHRRMQAGEELGEFYGKGFTHTGLWARMRHPNYAAEQAIWIVFYGFSVAATGRWINWTMAGCLLLLLLFQGSSDFSEEISAKKYPDYKDYQKRVPRFFPKFW